MRYTSTLYTYIDYIQSDKKMFRSIDWLHMSVASFVADPVSADVATISVSMYSCRSGVVKRLRM